ncbi:hypothetical protein E4T38_01880 [Aureobasidium subglaciale]|nr:hypothetical protein E4T38_01880 [Aureobasidium subglaciale]KAI5229344.1 hypothetical protein E4T40_01600 [Aureobasidium subglaciale]KAI5232871.1 hypothetical protein E4T41_01878 [Aureobasidium subglaciale]KAI5266402.1 hypothetical protein E4T46_01597 [Aureobasidium subglaciale]
MIQSLIMFPTEIMTLIASLAEVQDLRAFRFTCKTFHDAAAKPFGEAFFIQRSHVISHTSMFELLLMSANPKVGPYIRQLGFNSILLQPPPIPQIWNARYDNIGDQISKVVARAAFRQEQHRCLQSGAFEHLLTLVLRNLKFWGIQPITIQVYCNGGPYDGWGWLSLLPEDSDISTAVLRSPPRSLDRGAMQDIISAYLQAVRLSGSPLAGTILGFNYRSSGPTSILHYINGRTGAGHQLDNPSHDVPGGDLMSRRFPERHTSRESRSSVDFMHYVPATRSLELQAGTTIAIVGDFQALTTWLPTNSVTRLILKEVQWFWRGKLDVFLQRNRQLKYLEIHDCLFMDSEWSNIFDELSSEDDHNSLHDLEYCYFAGLRIEQPEIYPRGIALLEACMETHEFKSRDQIVRGLKSLSARLKVLEDKDLEENGGDETTIDAQD